MSSILLHGLALSVAYLPASIWISCCITTCLALSHGHFPRFTSIACATFSRSHNVLISRIIAQCIILMPALIMSFFTSKFGHIIPMYGQVIIPAIAYFTLYLSLRYAFVEVIVIAERANPIKALTLCNEITNSAALRIFILQQAYLLGFIAFNYLLYIFMIKYLPIDPGTVKYLTTTLLGTLNSFYIVITYYIYLSFSAGESYSEIDTVSEQLFGKNTADVEGRER